MSGLFILNPALIFFPLIGLVYLLVISRMLQVHGWREWRHKLLVIYCALSFVWTTVQILRLLNLPFVPDAFLPRLLLYGLLFLAILFVQLNRTFLRRNGRVTWFWWGMGLVAAVLAVLLNENLPVFPEMLPIGAGVPRATVGIGVLIGGWGFFMEGAALEVLRVYRRTQQPLHRNRIKYWSLALLLTVAGSGAFLFGSPVVGSSLYLFGTLNATYAILTYHLPDVRQMLRRGASYVVLTLVAVLFYGGVLWGAEILFHRVPGFDLVTWAGVTAAILAILLNPLLRLLQNWVGGWILRSSYSSSQLVRDYSASISNVLELERLAVISLDVICSGMKIRRGTLYVVHQELGAGETEEEQRASGSFQLRGIGEGAPSGSLPMGDPVAQYLGSEHACLTQYEIDLLPRFKEEVSQAHTWLDQLDLDVYVPIYAKGEWIGLFALGPKLSGDRYFEEDLGVLGTLADQTAVALENARLFDDLKMRNAEILRLNDELTAANQELARLDQAKTDFITIASHELRTPLTRIRGYNDILGQMIGSGTLLPDTGQQLTQGVNKAVVHLEEIVNTMFLVSKISTSTLVLNISLTSISSIVRLAGDAWGEALADRKQTLAVELLEEIPYIMADGKRLKEAFSHLIQNAIKYTPDGGRICVRGWLVGEALSPEEQSVEIVVSDSGIGVAPENAERIFDKFYRASDVSLHSTGDTKFKGAGPGLGLTIARGIIEAHGGQIWVESPGFDEQLCPGSEFHVRLPVHSRVMEPANGGEGSDAAD